MRLNDKADSKTSFIVSKIYCLFSTQYSVLKYYFLKIIYMPFKIQISNMSCLQFTHRKSTLVQELHLMIYCNITKNILSAISKRQNWKISLDFWEKSVVHIEIDELFGNKLLMLLCIQYHIKQMYVETYK